MKEAELKKLTTEKLKEKVKGHNTLIGISIGMIVFYLYILVIDHLAGKEMDLPFSIIMICCLGGTFSLFPELKAIKKELANRN